MSSYPTKAWSAFGPRLENFRFAKLKKKSILYSKAGAVKPECAVTTHTGSPGTNRSTLILSAGKTFTAHGAHPLSAQGKLQSTSQQSTYLWSENEGKWLYYLFLETAHNAHYKSMILHSQDDWRQPWNWKQFQKIGQTPGEECSLRFVWNVVLMLQASENTA